MAYNQNERDEMRAAEGLAPRQEVKTVDTSYGKRDGRTADGVAGGNDVDGWGGNGSCSGVAPAPSMWEAYKLFWKNYTNFSDRSRRSEVWWVVLVNFIISSVLGAIFIIPLLSFIAEHRELVETLSNDDLAAMLMNVFTGPGLVCYLLLLLYYVATLIPTLSLNVRRLHDIGMSGWWLVLLFIPCVNYLASIGLLVVYFIDSKPETNEYGPSPKYL